MAYEFVDPPRGLSYAAPAVDFGIFGDLPETYRKAQEQKRQADVANAFKGQPLPLDPATGLPDYGKIMQVLASKGGVDAITKLAPAATEQALIGQAAQPSPFFGGPAAGGAAPPSTSPNAQAAPQSLPAPPATASAGYTPMQNAPGSVVDIVSSKLPENSQATGAVIANIAKAAEVDPNAALSPEQSARVAQLVDGYVKRTGAARAPVGPATPAAGIPQMTPEALRKAGMEDSVRRAAGAPDVTSVPADQVGARFPATAAQPAMAQAGPGDTGGVPQAASQSPQGGPIVPPVPLPPGYAKGQEQQAVMALRAEAARRSSNPLDKQGPMLTKWADRIEESLQPIKIGQYDTYRDPATGRTVAQGPMAEILSRGGAGGINGATLDADAERYRQTGTLPPNMGRGMQGQAEAAAIRARAVEHETAAGGNPDQWATRWQEYRARGVGMNTGERVRASREENLNLILKVADAAIPAALEQSAKVWRSGFVPLNKIIQHGEVMTSDPELRAFGMANLQLAEAWARAMNPTGVMRQDDREKALSFLTTADSPETYRRLVNQLKTQITRERDSIRSGEPMRQGDSAPAPGAPAASGGGDVVRWERAPDGSLRKAQ